MKKNESERDGRKKMTKALDLIGKFFGMNKPTTHEILAKLVHEVLLHQVNNPTEAVMATF